MNRILTFVILAAVIVAPSPSAAQTVNVEVIPAHPSAGDQVSLRISPAASWIAGTVTRTGDHFRVDLQICQITCPVSLDVALGPLPAGTFTYEVYGGSDLLAVGAFAVVEVIPLLAPPALIILSVLLAGAGLRILSRYNFL